MAYIDPQFEKGYNPDVAEEGSFVPLDMSTLTEYPSAGWGKHARLVYIVGDIARVPTTAGGNSGLPYGADNYTVSYYGSTNNIHVIVYKLGSTTLKTRTFTYAASGAADNDKVTVVVDS